MMRWINCTFHQIMSPYQYILCCMSISWFELCQNLITLQNNPFYTFFTICVKF
jgi:hypothetical protein